MKGYVQGPEIYVTQSCGHTFTIRCIETTVEGVNFFRQRPCAKCKAEGFTTNTVGLALEIEDETDS